MEGAFQEVRKNEILRQPYLDKAIALCPESVSKIIYDPNLYEYGSYVNQLVSGGALEKAVLRGAQPSPNQDEFLVVPPITLIGKGDKHPIFVTNQAFKKYGIEELFLNSLIAHEGRHCNDLMHGIELREGTVINYENIHLIQKLTFFKMLEIRAYYNEAEQARKNRINHPLYRTYTRFCLGLELGDLRKINPISELETMIISEQVNIYSHL
ncbi:MAG TPA: hypothetical protein VJ461_01600 [Candidatus Nanoarchaeia archaeon]|nr:hypothetical protein [Candidatus Nanoarchaeia archaeon]